MQITTRVILFILATLLSGFGLFLSFALLMMPFQFPFVLDYMFIASVILALSTITAWFCYFRMGWLWIQNVQIPKKIAILGTISGCICIVPIFSTGVIIVSPAITLSCYMVYTALARRAEK